MGRRWIFLTVAVLLLTPSFSITSSGTDADDPPVMVGGKTTYYNSTTVYVEEPIYLDAGDSLIIDNSTMIFNCSYDGEVHIEANSSSSLVIRNGSLLTINKTGDFSDNGGYNYYVIANIGSEMEVSDSRIINGGYYKTSMEKYPGITTYANNSNFENVTFTSSYNKLEVRCEENVSIKNCIFNGSKIGFGIFLNPVSNGLMEHVNISGCYFSDLFTSINTNYYSNKKYVNVNNNTLINCTYGAKLLNCEEVDFRNNNISKIQFGPMNIQGNGNEIEGNDIRNCQGVSTVVGSYIKFRKNILLDCDGGLWISYTREVEISENLFKSCSDYGLKFQKSIVGTREFGNNINENIFESCTRGILGQGSSMNVTDNRINNSSSHGILILISGLGNDVRSFNDISNNLITNCNLGIWAGSDKGGVYRDNVFSNCALISHGGYCSNSIVINSTVKGSDDGIKFLGPGNSIRNSSVMDSIRGITISTESNEVKNCIVMDSNKGIVVESDSYYGEILDNQVINCTVGITSNNDNNVFSGNLMIDNSQHASDPGSAQWDMAGRGNYWSGLEGYYDNDADGIIDTPYYFDKDSIDRYPLIRPSPPYNRPPVILPVSLVTIESRSWFNYTLSADDPDDDEVIWTLEPQVGVDAWIDPDTGLFSFHPDDFDLGLNEFTVYAADGNGSNVSGTFEILVEKFNHPPAYIGPEIVDAYAGVEKMIVFDIDDVEKLTITGQLISTNAPFEIQRVRELQYRFNATYDQTGSYWAFFRFFDGGGKIVEKNLTINVLWKDRPPTISGPGDLIVPLMKNRTFQFIITDPDPDYLSVRLEYSGKGDAAYLGEGVVSLHPHRDDIGEQSLRVIVDDNNGSVISLTVGVMVILENDPPTGSESLQFTIVAGEREDYLFEVSDPEGDELTVSITKGGYWMFLKIDYSGLVISPTMKELGIHDIILSFRDSFDQEFIQHLTINVVEGPDVELILNIPERITEGESVSIPIFNDYSGEGEFEVYLHANYSVSNPAFVSLEGNMLTIQPVIGDNGIHSIYLNYRVQNGRTGNPVRFDIDVRMNLSDVVLGLVLLPSEGPYREDDTIDVAVTISGYPTTLPLQIVVYHNGIVHSTNQEVPISVWLTQKGTWEFIGKVQGYDINVSREIVVTDRVEEGDEGSLFKTVILFAVIILVGGLGIFGGIIAYRKVKDLNDDLLKSLNHGAKEVPKGFKTPPAAPGLTPSGPAEITFNENHYERPERLPDHEGTDR